MTSISQLMLRATPYEEVLHGPFPKDEPGLIAFLDGLDYVVEEWLESMKSHKVINCEQHAAKLLTQIIVCRYSSAGKNPNRKTTPSAVPGAN